MASTVTFDLELAVKDFNTNLRKVDKNLGDFHRDFKKDVNSSRQAWSSFAGNLASKAVSSAAAALTGLVVSMKDFGKEAFFAAVNAQETASKFEAVFSNISEKSEQTARDLQRNFGLGVTESKTLLSATGDLLTGFGFAQEGALDLSNKVQELSVDLASFTNFSGGAAGASNAITKALLGETESMKSLGVSIQQVAVDEQVAQNASEGLRFETDKQARAQATLDLIIQQSKNSIGDYGRTSGGAANQLKLLNTRIEDMKIAIGNKLIPVIAPLVKSMIQWVETNEDLITSKVEDYLDTLQRGFSYLAENIKAVKIAAAFTIGALLSFSTLTVATIAINQFSAAIVILKAAMVAISGPIAIVVTGLIALGGAIAWAMNQGKDGESIKKINELKVATADLIKLEQDLIKAKEMGSSTNITDAIQRDIDARKVQIAQLKEEMRVKNEIVTNDAKNEKGKEKLLKKKEKIDDKAKAETIKKNKNFLSTLFSQDKEWVTKQSEWNRVANKDRVSNMKSTLGSIATLSEHSNSTLADIGKAAAISMATIDGFAAVQKALASAPPPFNFALAALVGTATTANVAKIAGVKLEHGGIVGGSSFSGDSVHAQLNSGEMVLNRGQQAALFQQANGNGGGSGGGIDINMLKEAISDITIVVVADDNEIARSASRGVENGIVIGEK
jgi:hypothetical protein